LVGTPFESLTVPREIEGVADPTKLPLVEGTVGRATVPANTRELS